MEALTGITFYKPTAGMAAEKSARLDWTSMGKTTGLMKTHVDASLRDHRPQAGSRKSNAHYGFQDASGWRQMRELGGAGLSGTQ